jgi:predicted TIM-barrel fold metal-dependent hydrolase
MVTRRSLLKGAGALALGGMYGPLTKVAAAQARPPQGIQVPYSAGRQYPAIKVPENACDCHHHIYDPIRFPYVPEDVRNQPPAGVDAYRLLQKRLGISRNVIVQPSAYGFDNACTLDALEQMGANARAVVVIDPSISDGELSAMNQKGVRGIRFNIARGASRNNDTIMTLAQRVHAFGWHIQFWMSAKDTVDMESILHQLPNQIVFDHLGHIPQPEGIAHPAFKVICGLLEKGKGWVKLSGLYQDTKVGEPTYADTVKVGKAYVEFAPERMVWGSDWPHPSIFSAHKPWPDDAKMLDLLAEQAPDESLRHRILVTNPAILYGFDK